jgi:hypothetical protein
MSLAPAPVAEALAAPPAAATPPAGAAAPADAGRLAKPMDLRVAALTNYAAQKTLG